MLVTPCTSKFPSHCYCCLYPRQFADFPLSSAVLLLTLTLTLTLTLAPVTANSHTLSASYL